MSMSMPSSAVSPAPAAAAAAAADEHGNKRKSEDGSQQPRAKRNRYISIACNECKRRKIKCNGQTPCQRCGNLNLECLYAPNCCSNGFRDSEEFRQMSAHIASLQDQVDVLFSSLNSLRADLSLEQTPIDPSLQQHAYGQHPPTASMTSPPLTGSTPHVRRASSVVKRPSFRGPTSAAFNFSVAKSSLQTMGIMAPGDGPDEGGTTTDATPAGTPPPIHATKDPIWAISKDEAIRLCRVYEQEMGLLYPVLDIECVIMHATNLYRFMDAAARGGLIHKSFPGADEIADEDTTILKLVIANGLTVEGSGPSELGKRLFDCVQPAVDALLLGSADTKGIRMLALTAMYHFHLDNEGTAWRILGLTARLCIELGLHRRETYNLLFADESERSSAILLFWSIYVLDRRWSFGTGMPFALQDADIDPLLPRPVADQSPYLSAMVSYSNIGSKVWRSVANIEGGSGEINKDELNYLDYQVLQWHRTLPESLRFNHPSAHVQDVMPVSRQVHRMRVLLYMRANQMRTLIFRPVLHSATSVVENRDHAQTVVDVAKDTIRVLTHVNQTSDLYRSQQVLFNYFLISALAVLFLAVSHTPVIFARQVREEFYLALELVRGLSANSYVSKRLWKTIRVLKEFGPKLGLASRSQLEENNNNNRFEDPHSSAALAMAGLAGHAVDEMAAFGQQHQQQQQQQQPQTPWTLHSGSPNGMANDLTSLFEAAGGYDAVNSGMGMNGAAGGPYPVQQVGGAEAAGTGDAFAGIFGNEDELSKIIMDLF
ncbi:hypothetical protein LTR66_004302 [Elasticomyces elasticus]|nr:hypothetical protein LTR66_004302 [Elasticomyces elasticus]